MKDFILFVFLVELKLLFVPFRGSAIHFNRKGHLGEFYSLREAVRYF